jgi:hypothetical protein
MFHVPQKLLAHVAAVRVLLVMVYVHRFSVTPGREFMRQHPASSAVEQAAVPNAHDSVVGLVDVDRLAA